MRFTEATNYASRITLALVDSSPVKPIGVQQLAELHGVSPTYLSKIFTRIVKAGMKEAEEKMEKSCLSSYQGCRAS